MGGTDTEEGTDTELMAALLLASMIRNLTHLASLVVLSFFCSPPTLCYFHFAHSPPPIIIQLVDGACNDAFTTPHFHQFYSNPWGSLQEDYYQCTEHLIQAVWSAAGIAQGAAMLFAPLFILVVIYINVYGIKLMKRATDTPSAGAAAATEDEEAGGESPPPDLTAATALADRDSSGLHSSAPQTNKNGYESVWGWEKPFK